MDEPKSLQWIRPGFVARALRQLYRYLGRHPLYGATPLLLVAAAQSTGACVTQEDRPATWSYIHTAIIEPSCATASCHSSSVSTSGFDFSDRETAYREIAGTNCGGTAQTYVVAGKPDESQLLRVLRAWGTERMPPDIALPEAEINLIERWIAEGAKCE